MGEILLTREVVKKWPQESVDHIDYLGVFDDVDAAKEFVRGYARRYFERDQMEEFVGRPGTLFTWECPGRDQTFGQRFGFRPIARNPKPPVLGTVA